MAHGECPHLMYGPGGGFNPRRLRLEFGAGQCKCDCHAECPITSDRATVNVRVWRESCTCPGAPAERSWQDENGGAPPDFGELWAKSREKSQARRAAFDAVRAGAPGKTRAELEAGYIAELRSRGLDIPPRPVLDVIVDALTGNHATAYTAGLRFLGESISGIWKLFDDFRPPR